MREFFKGWRRKLGCVALVMAMILIVGWMRSAVYEDVIRFWVSNDRIQMFFSSRGTLSWWGWSDVNLWPPEIAWWYYAIPENGIGIEFPPDVARRRYRYSEPVDRSRFACWSVPYWWLVAPLTLLSAYLILWKPRKKDTTNA